MIASVSETPPSRPPRHLHRLLRLVSLGVSTGSTPTAIHVHSYRPNLFTSGIHLVSISKNGNDLLVLRF